MGETSKDALRVIPNEVACPEFTREGICLNSGGLCRLPHLRRRDIDQPLKVQLEYRVITTNKSGEGQQINAACGQLGADLLNI